MEETWRGAPVPGACGVVCREDGWKMLHLLAYLAELAAQNSMLPSVVPGGFHVSTDIPSRGTGGGNSLGEPSAYIESSLLHTEGW